VKEKLVEIFGEERVLADPEKPYYLNNLRLKEKTLFICLSTP